jgi:hypothetical protein
MASFYTDTSPAMEVLQVQLLRAAPPWRKTQMLAGVNASAKNLALTGLRQHFPHVNEAELNRWLAYLLLGPDLARKPLGEVEDAALSRAGHLSIEPPAEAWVATSEDTLLAKLEWYRKGGEVSERQWPDRLGILEVQAGDLDLDYLFQLSSQLDVGELLERALKQAAL